MRLVPSPRRRARGENIVPMINVVFLLLIFFLMTARIAPPEPFEINPPRGRGDAADPQAAVLLIGAGGEFAFRDARGEDALAALSALDPATPLAIRADGALPAARLAALLPRLAAMGFERLSLVTVPAEAR